MAGVVLGSKRRLRNGFHMGCCRWGCISTNQAQSSSFLVNSYDTAPERTNREATKIQVLGSAGRAKTMGLRVAIGDLHASGCREPGRVRSDHAFGLFCASFTRCCKGLITNTEL